MVGDPGFDVAIMNDSPSILRWNYLVTGDFVICGQSLSRRNSIISKNMFKKVGERK